MVFQKNGDCFIFNIPPKEEFLNDQKIEILHASSRLNSALLTEACLDLPTAFNAPSVKPIANSRPKSVNIETTGNEGNLCFR